MPDIVVIGRRREDGEVLSWLEAGTSGYVTREESLAHLHQAIVETLDFGARVEPDDVSVLLRWLRHHTRTDHHRTTVAADALTEREREVAGLMCRHLSNKQNASELWISIHTAKHHVRGALAKLGVERRVHVASALCAAEPRVRSR